MAPGTTGYQCVVGIEEFLEDGAQYDYIIVGGGTAGLVLANRLSEDASTRVAVLEAGGAHLDDPKILTPGLFLSLLHDDEYDWQYKTLPQRTGREHYLPRGKGLGGSSATNFMIYGRSSRGEFDAWEKFGGSSWSWDSIFPYMQKVERLDSEVKEKSEGTESVRDLNNYGTGGLVHISQPAAKFPYESALYESVVNSGLLKGRKPGDVFGGDNMAHHEVLNSIDQSVDRGTRSYATSAYLKTIPHRPNLKILCDALVAKVTLSDSETPTATGIEFEHAGQLYTLNAAREVLLCAGAMETPKILELSGIGDPKVLAAAGIKTRVSNPAVGEYYQDHLASAAVYELVPGELSADIFKTPEAGAAAAKEYEESRTGALAGGGNVIIGLSSIDLHTEEEKASLVALVKGQKTGSDITDEIMALQADNLLNKAGMDIAIIPLPIKGDMLQQHNYQNCFALQEYDGKCHITVCCQLRRSFSLGSIHISEADFHSRATLDPRYLSHPADLVMLSKASQALQKAILLEPFASKIARRIYPAEDIDLGNINTVRQQLLKHHNTEFHPCGTAGMGRVVDGELKVIGVNGLRVIDASIFPVLPSSNTQSLVYAVAEKAADLIKNHH